MFLTGPLTTIPNLLEDFNNFRNLTNFKINFSKYTALNISLPSTISNLCRSDFPFSWNAWAIKYLGIQLPTCLNDLYSLNYTPLLQNIWSDLLKWSSGLFSWFGRAAIIKINILPRILYILQTVPIVIPQAFFSSYKKICTDFVWNKFHPRLNYDRLTTPKPKGGIGLPDIFKYYQACCLTRFIDWNVHYEHKDWVKLEQLFSPLPLTQILWIKPHNIHAACKQHPLIRPTLLTFRRACNKHEISSANVPMTPVKLNPDFTPGMHSNFLSDGWPHPTIRAGQFFLGNKLLSQTDLANKINKVSFHFWTYVQLRNFLLKPNPRPD